MNSRPPNRPWLMLALSLLLLAPGSLLQAQSLRFFARPVEAFEGDAVVFTYRNDLSTVHLPQIAGWRWDFNGDGVWDEEKNLGEIDGATGLEVQAAQINTNWYAVLDETLAVNGVQTLTPVLQVRLTGDPPFDTPGFTPLTQTGATENIVGPLTDPESAGVDANIFVKDRSVGNADVTVNFSVNPRLANAADVNPANPIRLYSLVKPADKRTLVSTTYAWTVTRQGGGSTNYTTANPQLSGLADGVYDVTLSATYTVSYLNAQGQTATSSGTLAETKKDAFRIVSVLGSLQKGRAYRRGFPETYGWEDIMEAYQAIGPGNNRYTYFHHFEDAFFTQQGLLLGDEANAAKRQTMAEIVNECLQGQLLIANQGLIEALRIKYPRLAATVDPEEDRLNPPAGTREETAAIDTALLDYQLPIHYAGLAIQLYGTDILRNKAAEGAEPYPQFPQYLTFIDPTLSQAPIPVKNEYWQLSTALERMCLGRMEKAKKLYRLSVQDSTAREEAKTEAKNTGLHSYLGMALLASGQSEQNYQMNEGNNLLAHQKNARDLFERINAGLNPLGNDGSFIPNESFAAAYQDATEAVADAREAEINARQEERTWEHYQAELRNEHLAQRNNYLTPLKNLTSIDPALYNDLRTVDDHRDYRAVVQSRLEALLEDYPNADARILGELGSNVISVLDAHKGMEAARNDLVNLYKRVDLAKWATTRIDKISGNATSQSQAVDVLFGLASGYAAFRVPVGQGSTNPLSMVAGQMTTQARVLERAIQDVQRSQISDVTLQKEVQGMLLDVGNLRIAIDRAQNAFAQSRLALDNQLARMDRLIEDLAHTRDTAADLYFHDPSFRVVVSQAMRRAESEMDYAIDRLYRLAKTLQYEWTEAYQNPVIIPVNSQEPASLENPLFDKFTQVDSLFFIRTADEAKDYLDALKAWDSKLRRINVVSVRGPNHSGPISAEPISMRETILNLTPDATRGYTLEHNGPFGIAWSDGLLSIQRQTEKGLPTYGNADKFILGGEELVPLSDGSYRTENEGEFRRIVRDGTGWIIYAKNGTRHFLGSKPLAANPSRIVRPGGGATFDDTFKWCVDDVIDVHGNHMEHLYTTFPDSPGNTYCVEIRYSIFGANFHAIAFDFETRADAFTSFLSGFSVRTGRRCQQIRVLSQGSLVRRYKLGYTLPADDPIEPIGVNDAGQLFSMLRQVTQFDSGPTDANFLPPLRLGYTRFDPALVQRGSFLNPAPASLGNPNLALADINCDSLPDFFFTNPVNSQHSVVYNHGLGRFSAPTNYTVQPTGITLDQAGADLADYDGDGRIDLVQKAGTGHFVFFPNTTLPRGNDDTHPTWGTERSFTAPYPPFELNDPTVRTLDLNGDKLIDFMKTTAAGFVYYYNRGTLWEEDGIYLFGEPQMGDITFADALTFDDAEHVKLADMNGDRLLDLVRVHLFQQQLEITYWPNKGRGSWGTRTPMTGTIALGVIPIEDAFVRDLNGDGLADVLAVAYDHVSYWLNLGNHGFSRRFEVSGTPDYIKGTTVLQQADINGNGTTDLLWENWDASAGAYRIGYVDFIGTTKPNLLAVIDNGIGLRTEMSYRTSTDFYTAALRGSNPWSTRLPFPSWCVSKISKRFGLDLDALPGEDRYVTEFSYHDGYYDAFEKEFRGFAFAKKVERGDDRLTDGGPAPEVNSPSTLTRLAFHTGVPDGVDNDGDNATDEFDPISGYEEESLKGKVLWTETCVLDTSFNGVDDDLDGFIDESDEGTDDGQLSADALVFTREYQNWSLKTIHSSAGGFTQPGADLPFATTNGQKVTFPFSSFVSKEIIEAVSTLHSGNSFATGASTAVITSDTQVDFFGNPTLQRTHGVTSGGVAGITYDDERHTTTQYAFNLSAWLIGLPTEVSVTDESWAFVSKSRNYYDNLAFGQIGTRGLMTSEEKFIGTSSTAFPAYSAHPGDPRVGANASLISTTIYDAYGNPTTVRDPSYTGPGGGHERVYGYDPVFHTYVETETIKVGGGSADLVASATYDRGGGVITTSTDFNANVSTYQYDSFFRLVGIVKPGDTPLAPTQVFTYQPGDPVRSLDYTYSSSGALTLSVTAATPVVSRVTVKSRETAGGGTFDIVQITDGAGHKLGTIEEGEVGSQFVYKDVKRYTSRGAERDSYLPFFGASPAFMNPPPDGYRVTDFYDAAGRAIRTVNPPETTGGPRKATRTDYFPLKTALFDEEDNDPASPHFNTPHLQYKDGLDRLVGVDEINKESNTPITYPTRYTYDLLDNLIRILDSRSNQKSMRYDGLKRMVFMHDPDRGVMTYTYDAASNLTRTLDAKSQEIVMAYDGANRIQSEDYLDAAARTPDVTYFYDTAVTVPAGDGTSVTSQQVKGKLASVTDLSGGEVLSYDARGRTAWKIKRIPDPKTGVLASYMSQFAYDSLDRLTQLTYPDGDHVGYTYNTRNLPETITGGPGGFIVPNMNYLASGQLDTTSYGNGVATTYQYDPRLRLRSLITHHSSLITHH